MKRPMTAAMEAAIQADLVRPAIFVKIDTAGGVVRAWTGVGTISWGGANWLGLGELIAVQPAQETTDLRATGARVMLSGVPAEFVSMALQSIRHGLEAEIYLGAMEVQLRDGPDWDGVPDVDAVLRVDDVGLRGIEGGGWALGDLVVDPILIFQGLTDVPDLEEDGQTARIGITLESDLIDLRRPRVRRYTHEDQIRSVPGDFGFSFVPGLQDRQIIFGRS